MVLYDKLYSHQKEAVRYIMQQWAQGKGTILADDMGLGKTISAIVAAEEISQSQILVVCPASLKLNWEQEIQAWSPYPETWTVYKYNDTISATRKKQFLQAVARADVIILDESHYIKTPQSQRTKAILSALAPYTRAGATVGLQKCVICLSGTPQTNTVLDWYPQLRVTKAFGEGKPPTKTEFDDKFCRYKTRPLGRRMIREYKGVQNGDLLRVYINNVLLRRKKDEVLDLPDKLRSFKYVPSILNFEDTNFAEMTEEEIDYQISLLDAEHVATLRKNNGLAKLSGVVDYIDQCARGSKKHPKLIFAYHTELVEELAQELQAPTITGQTPLKLRQERVEAFQNNRLPYLVCNIVAAGVGLTLTKSSHVIFAELDYSPANLLQAEDRVYRIGQTKKVLIEYLVGNTDFEKSMLKLIRKKLTEINMFVK